MSEAFWLQWPPPRTATSRQSNQTGESYPAVGGRHWRRPLQPINRTIERNRPLSWEVVKSRCKSYVLCRGKSLSPEHATDILVGNPCHLLRRGVITAGKVLKDETPDFITSLLR